MGSNSASTGGGGGGVGPAGVRVTKTGKKKYGTKSSAVVASTRNELRTAVKEFKPLPVKIIKAIVEAPKKSKQNVLDYEGQAAGVTPMRSPKFVPMGNDGNDNNGGAIESTGVVVQAPKVDTAPTEAEVSQVTTAEATPEEDILLRKRKTKRRGRSPTILTGVTGATGGLTLGKPSLLGRA